MKLNLTKWNRERLNTQRMISDLKKLIRAPAGHEVPYTDYATKTVKHRTHRGGTYAEYVQLANLKHQATLLCQMRAHLRGKLHCQYTLTYRKGISTQGEDTGRTYPVECPCTMEQQEELFAFPWAKSLLAEEEAGEAVGEISVPEQSANP